jgi:hypothetical protein
MRKIIRPTMNFKGWSPNAKVAAFFIVMLLLELRWSNVIPARIRIYLVILTPLFWAAIAFLWNADFGTKMLSVEEELKDNARTGEDTEK